MKVNSYLLKRLFFNKKSFYFQIVLSILTLLFTFFLFLYIQFQNAALKTIAVYNNDFIEQIGTVSTALVNNIKSSAMQIFYTSSISKLRTSTALTNAERINGLRDLGKYVGSSDFLDSVMIYNYRLNTIFTSEGDRTSAISEDFYDHEASEILTHPWNYPYLVPIKRTSSKKSTYSFLFFEYQNSSALLVNIKDSWFVSNLLGTSQNKNHLIINKEGEIIATENEEYHHAFYDSWKKIRSTLSESPETGFLPPKIFSSQIGWVYYHIPNSNYYCLKPIRLETASPGLLYIRNFLYISFSVIGILFLVFIMYLVITVYFPLHKIKSLLHQSDKNTTQISHQIEQLITYRNKNLLSEKLADLHKGILPPDFSYPVLLFTVHHCEPEKIQNVLKKFSSPSFCVTNSFKVEGAVSACSHPYRQDILSAFLSLSDITFYLSNLCHSDSDLKQSAVSLNELEQLHFLYPEQCYLTEEVLNQCHALSSLKAKDVSAMITALKTGQEETANHYWESIFTAIRLDRYAEFCFAVHYIGKQINNIFSEFNMEERWDSDSLLEQAKALDIFQNYIKKQFSLIISTSIRRKNEQLAELSKKIDLYIENNYTDPDLSPQLIASYFEMNTAYLSRKYKQITNNSLPNAIHQCRIEHACTLLKNTENSIESIAQTVGYNNVKYFYVLFKKEIEMTPNQYREYLSHSF